MLARLCQLITTPDEQPALLSAHKRQAFAKAIHPRLGAAPRPYRRQGGALSSKIAAAFATHDVLQKIAFESGLRSECETYAQVVRWRQESARVELELLNQQRAIDAIEVQKQQQQVEKQHQQLKVVKQQQMETQQRILQLIQQLPKEEHDAHGELEKEPAELVKSMEAEELVKNAARLAELELMDMF